MTDTPFFNFRNVLILLGITITTLALIFFANEFSDIISEWGRVIDLLLLSVIYVSLGLHFAGSATGDELVERPGWRWLRVTTAFYILGIVAGFASVLAFLFGVSTLDRVWKLLIVVLLGLGLIMFAGWRYSERHPRT